MIQRKHPDFFENLAKDIAKLFASLLGFNIEDAEKHLEIAYEEWFGLDRKTFDALSPDEMMAMLTNNPNIEINHLELMAELFAKEGKWYFAQRTYLKSQRKLEKALNLFDFVDQKKQLFSFERQLLIEDIKSTLKTIKESHSTDNDLR